MLNKNPEINRNQLFRKFNSTDSMFYVPPQPWEAADLDRNLFRGEFDSLWRTSLAYITYKDIDLKNAIVNCFRKFEMINFPGKYWYQASRASNRYGEDDVSRDQVILALVALKLMGDEVELKEIASHLPFRLSRRFRMTPGMWFWVKYLATGKSGFKTAYLLMNLIEHCISVPMTKGLRLLAGATKPVALPHDKNTVWPFNPNGWKAKTYKVLGYPEYGLHFASWMIYSINDNSLLTRMNKGLMRWQMQDSNLLLRILLDGKLITNEEIKSFKPTNTFMWQRRTDFSISWVYELKPKEYEYNNYEVDILYALINRSII